MSRFTIDKKGYSQQEVDDYINNLYLKYEEKLSEQKDRVFALKAQQDKTEQTLQSYIEKDKQISQALVYAVEKAEQIETSAKKIYELELQRVRLLYNRWEELLLEVEAKYPQIKDNASIKTLLQTFKDSIGNVLEQNFNLGGKLTAESLKTNLKKNNDSYVKNIINKMEYAFDGSAKQAEVLDSKPQTKKEVISDVLDNYERESNRISNIAGRLSAITKNTKKESGIAPVDQFLNSEMEDEFKQTAYAKNITRKKSASKQSDLPFSFATIVPNESGFDLKEALNPKEDLDEIMKAFDFFDK